MIAIPHSERQRLASLLEHASQAEVMSRIPQFEETEITRYVSAVPPFSGLLNVLVFNMERGVHLNEIADFLEQSPEACPFDVILANELDDGCTRSGQVNTTKALAERLGMDAVFGLEFIELVNQNDKKDITETLSSPAFPSNGPESSAFRKNTTGILTGSAESGADLPSSRIWISEPNPLRLERSILKTGRTGPGENISC